MENSRIADIFDEIADLLELKKANEFRVRSYRNAARTVRGLSDRLEDLAGKEGEDLSDLPNIGDSTAEKIHEIVETGTCKRLEDLREELPEGLTQIMKTPGVGPRKAMELYEELGVESLDDLKKAAEAGKVRDLEGMGEKTEENILKGIETVKKTAGRMLLSKATENLESLSAFLDGLDAIKRFEPAGSLRRGKETIGDLDVLVEAKDREAAAKAILSYEAIDDVIGKGREKVSVRLESGAQVDFRFFESSCFGAALLYFTGSKAHNIKLRRLAQDNDWKLNEYGLFKGDNLLAGKTEKAVYERLNLDWVPPELREDRGEIEAARDGDLPKPIEQDDVRGDFQCHTTASDGKNSIKEMAEAARDFGFDFLGITDHTKRVTMANGLDDDEALEHADKIREVDERMKRFWLMAGIEVDVLKSGKLDLKEKTLEKMDWVVASVHYDRAMSRKDMTRRVVKAMESGVVHCLGHPLGRLIGKRDPIAIDLDEVFQAAVDNDVWIEINAQPDRLDLPDTDAKAAKEAGVKFCLSTDSHDANSFHMMRYGVLTARRAWLEAKDVLNTLTITKLRKAVKR